ncbi:MAG: hypothetical protein ACK559_34455, partial [bacterium]
MAPAGGGHALDQLELGVEGGGAAVEVEVADDLEEPVRPAPEGPGQGLELEGVGLGGGGVG